MRNVYVHNSPLPIGAFQDQCKKTMRNKYSNKHNLVKNHNRQEADQLAIYKHGQDVKLGVSERDLNPRPTDFKSSALTTRKRCLLISPVLQQLHHAFNILKSLVIIKNLIFQVIICNPYLLIFFVLDHPSSLLVYYHLFGIFVLAN